MPNILLDISRLLTRRADDLHPTGVDRVGLAYIHRYREQARAVLSERGFSRILSPRYSQLAFDLLSSNTVSRAAIRDLIVLGLLTSRSEHFEQAVLLHTSHNGMERSRYYRDMRRQGIKSVFMIHDLIPLTHAEYCRQGVDVVHRLRIHTALRHADGLITNSQDTQNALASEARQADLPVPPCVIAHLAPGVTERTGATGMLAKPYFVMLGTIEPRKNHWFMLHVWRRLVEQLGERAPKLIVIGRRGWECENVVDMLERCTPLKNSVIEESDCTDEQLRTWLQHAQALLFPSFVEGYGMPLVEALALGVPVIASNLGVFHEIAGNIPDYLDPLDGLGWLSRVQIYTRPDSLERTAQLDRLTGFHVPTWAKHFEQVDQFLETLFQ